MSSMVGTAFSCGRFVRSGYVDWGLAVPAAACSLAASVGGARLSMLLPEERFRVVLMVMLPVVAALTLRRRALLPATEEMPRGRRRAVMCCVAGEQRWQSPAVSMTRVSRFNRSAQSQSSGRLETRK